VVDRQHIDIYESIRLDAHTLGIETNVLADLGNAGEVQAGYIGFSALESTDPIDATVDAVSPADPACVLFTGGTTGLPKATLRSHFSYMCSAVRWGEVFEPRSDDRYLSAMHLFHSGGQEMGFCGPLMHGVPTMLPEWFSASSYWDIVREWGATIIEALPSIMTIMVKRDPTPDDKNHSVRIAVGSGPARDEFTKRFDIPVVEVYGMTETGTMLITSRAHESRAGSVGRARGWCDLAILGDRDEPLPAGELGEVCVRPTIPYSMTSGYLGRAEETVARWRNLWLHTGDLGRLDNDGWLYLAGRQAYWIRRRGENVSVEEVEQVLDSYPAVLDAAVIGVASEYGDQDVHGYVVFRPGMSATFEELQAWCADRLAYFKVPIEIRVVLGLPRSVTKNDVERHKLPELDAQRLTPVAAG